MQLPVKRERVMESNRGAVQTRKVKVRSIDTDLVVVGGGLSGICCAITAARMGTRVVLIQDRPVLGGNASSEVRLWILGATSHMGNNNRWARESGVIDELLVDNMWRNPEGNAVIFDSLLLESVVREPNIELLLNTAISDAEVSDAGRIVSVSGFCSQNQTEYAVSAPLFCDASGDGILGYLAGAIYRVGAEARDEFAEALAPVLPSSDLLGHSLYFYSRETGKPVAYTAPEFALKDITKIPRYRDIRLSDIGCRLWWLEYGGIHDTVHDTEEIKWELWRIAYGIWDHIKNSGSFPGAETLTLEWMGMIPGKRESRRFEGDYMLSQQDIVEQRQHYDAASFGGWAIDLHPAEGVYSAESACTQWHSKGVYQIPYRTMYSRNVSNLFLTGRIISASHIAFGSTRVMATCAHNGQAVGVAASLCVQQGLLPVDLSSPQRVPELQQALLRSGQHIPGVVRPDMKNKAKTASISASSSLQFGGFSPNGPIRRLDQSLALLVPLTPGHVPAFRFFVQAAEHTTFEAELWVASKPGNFTPDKCLGKAVVNLEPADSSVCAEFHISLERQAYAFIVLPSNPAIAFTFSKDEVSGVLTLTQKANDAVAKAAVQDPPPQSGVDRFAFWLPARRPGPRNIAVSIEPPVRCFEPENSTNGFERPWTGANAWVPDRKDARPCIELKWTAPETISRVELVFDTDFDHPMESVLMGHPERIMPACVTAFQLVADDGTVLADVKGNHQTRWGVSLPEPIATARLTLHIEGTGRQQPALFGFRCYE
jgi:hypothetical protein